MKIIELQRELENLHNNLYIASETVNAVENAISQGSMVVDQVCWALVGVMRDINQAIEDVEDMTKETIQINKVLEELCI